LELDTSALDAGLAQEGHGFLRRHHRPRVIAVVDVGIDDGQVGRPADGRRDEQQQQHDDHGHARHHTWA
jgi:hypothetical protein